MATLNWSLHWPSLAVWRPSPSLGEMDWVSPLMSSSPISNLGLCHDRDQLLAWAGPEGSEPCVAIITASSTHSAFCSQIRHRPMSAQIATRKEGGPLEGLE